MCLVFGCVVLVAAPGRIRAPNQGRLQRITQAVLLLTLACFLLSLGFGSIALMNRWGAATSALEGAAVISGSLLLLLPLVFAIGAGVRAVARRLARR